MKRGLKIANKDISHFPNNWKSILKKCNMALARRELSNFFQIANQTAKAEGKEAVFKTEFVNGWNDFAKNPCYETAVAWFKKAPEGVSIIFKYFQESCPGGFFHRAGFKTAMSFNWGKYSLEIDSSSLENLKELTEKEYIHFSKQFCGEAIYHVSPIDFLGKKWDIMIGMVDNKVYKMSAFAEIQDRLQAVKFIRKVFKTCEVQLGTPSEEQQGLYIWDKPDGNIILQTASVMDATSINIYATSNIMKNKPKLSE